MVLKDSSLRVRKMIVVIARALWVAPVKGPCLLAWLVACLALMAAPLVVSRVVAVVWGKEALWCLILACNVTNTCLWCVAFVVSIHDLKAAASVSAIHWWTLDWHWLGASLLMRVYGLLLDLVMMLHRLRFLPTASKIAASVSKHLIIGQDIIGRVANLRLGNTLVDGASRWRHWIWMHHYGRLLHRWRQSSAACRRVTKSVRMVLIRRAPRLLIELMVNTIDSLVNTTVTKGSQKLLLMILMLMLVCRVNLPCACINTFLRRSLFFEDIGKVFRWAIQI